MLNFYSVFDIMRIIVVKKGDAVQVATEDKKLTSSEIEDMLKEVESDYTPVRRTNNNRKKKPKVRTDMKSIRRFQML